MHELYTKKLGYDFQVNQRTDLDATPLHFAVIHLLLKNVELLIKLGAEVNA